MRGARPFARSASVVAPKGWASSLGGRRRATPSAPSSPLALFGGYRTRLLPDTTWDVLGDIDPSNMPYGAARNYGTAAVEAWRPLIESLAGDLPVEYLLAWIAYESAGDPCSWTSYQEASIFQLMPPDNFTQAGTTMAMMHPVPPCAAGSGRPAGTFGQLSDAVATEQVRAGVQYVNYCRAYVHAKLDTYGYDWSESSADFWMLVKMVHALPSAVAKMLQAGIDANGGPVSNWEDLKAAALSAGAVNQTLTHNAETVGQYGDGGGSALGGSASILMIGAVGVGLWYLLKRTKRRASR